MNLNRPPALSFSILCALVLGCIPLLAQNFEQSFGTGYPIFSEKLADGNFLHVADSSGELLNFISDENGQLIAQIGTMGTYAGDVPHLTKTPDGSFIFLDNNQIKKYALQGNLLSTTNLVAASARFEFKETYGVGQLLNSRGYLLIGEERTTKMTNFLFLNINGDLIHNIPLTDVLPSSQLKAAKLTTNFNAGFLVEMVFTDGNAEVYSLGQISPDGKVDWIQSNLNSFTHSISLQNISAHKNGPIATVNLTDKADPNKGYSQFIAYDQMGANRFVKSIPDSATTDLWVRGIATIANDDDSYLLAYETNRNSNTSANEIGLYYESIDLEGTTQWNTFDDTKSINAISNANLRTNILQKSDGCFSVIAAKDDQLWIFQPPTPNCAPSSKDSIDLTVRLTADTRTPGIYQNVSITFSVANTGGGVARNIIASLPLPADLAVTGLQVPSGNYNTMNGEWRIPEIAPNELIEMKLELFTLTMDPILIFGQVLVTNLPDTDSKPNNNTDRAPKEDDETSLLLNPSAGTPDLLIENVASVYKYYADSTNTITYDLRNRGTSPVLGDYEVGVFLSVDDFLDDRDMPIGQLSASDTPIGVLNGLMTSVKMPSGIMAGNYYLILKADNQNIIQEQNESNNILVQNILVEAPPRATIDKPDLEVNISAVSTTYNIYVPMEITITVTNAGGRPARDIIVAFPFPEATAFVESSVSTGTFNNILKHWDIEEVAPGETHILSVTIFPLENSKPIPLFAQVTQAFPEDYDSTPGNAECCTVKEDDESSITIVPAVNFRNATSKPDIYNKALSILRTYPNPVVDLMNIDAYSNQEKIEFLIVNAQGQVVKNGWVSGTKLQTWTFGLSELKSGFYSLLFRTNAKIEKVPFVKMEP